MTVIRPEDVPAAFQAAWNAHDMRALGRLFDEGATFVSCLTNSRQNLDIGSQCQMAMRTTLLRKHVIGCLLSFEQPMRPNFS
jgi:hypothetical protein